MKKDENPWINIAEALPPELGVILFYTPDGDIHIGDYSVKTSEDGKYEGRGWFIEATDEEVKGVEWWRPLPAPPPKEKG